jgi:hypothetical protein
MKNVLVISSNYAIGGVIHKYVYSFVDSLVGTYNVTIATSKSNVSVPCGCNLLQSMHIPTRWYDVLMYRLFKRTKSYVPDVYHYSVSPFLYKKCEKYLRDNKVDILHSFNNACSTHLIAHKLKQKYNLPWVAHFLDAWVGNPFRNIKDEDSGRDAEYEKIIAENADVIVHTNKVIAQQWVERYGDIVRKKIRIIPLCYSSSNLDYGVVPDFLVDNEPKRVCLTYIGTCAGDRNFQSLIQAVYRLSRRIDDLESMLEVRILGNLLDIDKKKIEDCGLKNVFNYVGRKSGNELMQNYIDADIFLVVDAPLKENIFFPSKLLDYFLYKKPILGISPQVGVTSDLLQSSFNHCYDNSDIIGIEKYLERAVTNYSSLLGFDRNFYKQFLPEEISKAYKTILKELGI